MRRRRFGTLTGSSKPISPAKLRASHRSRNAGSNKQEVWPNRFEEHHGSGSRPLGRVRRCDLASALASIADNSALPLQLAPALHRCGRSSDRSRKSVTESEFGIGKRRGRLVARSIGASELAQGDCASIDLRSRHDRAAFEGRERRSARCLGFDRPAGHGCYRFPDHRASRS